MAATSALTEVQRPPMPEIVEVDPSSMPPHSPRELTLLKAMTGRGFQELVNEDADDGDRATVLIWFKLRRLGFDPTWEEAGNVLIQYVTPDPPSAGVSTNSPPSVTGGE